VINLAEKIQFKGIDEIDDMEKSEFKSIATKYYSDFVRDLKNDFLMLVHIKTHRKTDKKEAVKELVKNKKSIHYSVHVRLEAPGLNFEASENGYEGSVFVLKSVFKKLEKEIQKRFNR
jgi:hypothetical protein